MRVALGLEYDGRYFEGWQTQPSGQTVQDYLESAVVQFTGEKIKAVCAGRTDAKVHACGQVVHLDTEADRKEVSWIRGLNSYLPSEVAGSLGESCSGRVSCALFSREPYLRVLDR